MAEPIPPADPTTGTWRLKQIGLAKLLHNLSISERTVTTHVANIYSKLHVNNRVSAIQEAMRRRILDYNP